MSEPRKIKPPAPIKYADRTTMIPPTIGARDHDERPPMTAKNHTDFRQVEFERAIEQHGKFVIWRKAMQCPCMNLPTRQARLDCTDCDGSGFVYIDPIEIRAHMAQFDKRTRATEKFGTLVEGTGQVTVLPRYRLGFRDSIEMRDSVMDFNELILKGNRRGPRSKLPTSHDSARYRITNVTHLGYRVETDTGCGISFLEEGYHFRISKDGWIEWTHAGNTLVPDGVYLSIRYDFKPVYIVVSHPHAFRDDTFGRDKEGFGVAIPEVRALPVQAAVQLDFLAFPDTNTPYAPVTGS